MSHRASKRIRIELRTKGIDTEERVFKQRSVQKRGYRRDKLGFSHPVFVDCTTQYLDGGCGRAIYHTERKNAATAA